MEKSKKKKKKILFPGRPYEIDTIELFLQEKAKEGWMFVKRSGAFYVFEECEPVIMQFKVDYFRKGIMLGKDPDPTMEYYIDYFKHYGWQHLYSAGKVQILCAPEGTPWPIQSDEKSKFKMAMKIAFHDNIVLSMLGFFIASISLLQNLYYNIMYPFNYTRYSSSITDGMTLGLVCFLFLCVLYALVCTVRFGIFFIDNTRRIKKGLPIKYYSRKNAYRFAVICKVVWLVLLGVLLLSISIFSKTMSIFILLVMVLAIVGSVIMYKLFPKKEFYTTLTVFSDIALGICLVCIIGGLYIFPSLTGTSSTKTEYNVTYGKSIDYDSSVSIFGKLEQYTDVDVSGDKTIGYSIDRFTSRFTSVMETYNDLVLTDRNCSLSKLADAESNWGSNLVYQGTKYESDMYVVIGEGITLVITGELNSTQAAALSSYYIK